MKVCGFSFVRNGVKFDYPFEEAIKSILPLCDKVIVAVGNSDDDTAARVKAIDPKVEVLNTTWATAGADGARVFALETDKAFQAIPKEYDWAFYIQGDEVIHEKYIPIIREEMQNSIDNSSIEGLLFKYVHFFGSFEYVGLRYSWYRREIRIIRNRKDIFSYRDAQGFRKKPNEKLHVKLIDAYVYHYGYVREPKALQDNVKVKNRLYKSEDWIKGHIEETDKYEYENLHEPVKKFMDTHPSVMLPRIARKNWVFNPNLSIRYASAKDRFKRVIGELTGWYPGEYKNYKMLK
jgi:hypothetical protein